MMRRGFTILELLVASFLLGMLVTILTMFFNQSSIAWRTGKASSDDMDTVRDNIAGGCDCADNIFAYDGKAYRMAGLWDENNDLRIRAYVESDTDDSKVSVVNRLKTLVTKTSTDLPWEMMQTGSGAGSKNFNGYVVNIMSAGPNKKFGDYDDIWSNPDEFE